MAEPLCCMPTLSYYPASFPARFHHLASGEMLAIRGQSVERRTGEREMG